MALETIIERLQRYTGMNPGAPILFDDAHAKGITYAQLDDLSGRIYSWLKENKIGREDFVLINLPRGVLPVIAMIGVWKAGAAWALVEDTYAPERIRYIREDCGCRLEISAENWDEIMALPALAGHENPDEHDAAYAIYTSGTTGSPKGVLHEYGNLQRAIDSIRIDGQVPFNEKDRLATLAPMNFVATVIVILAALNVYCGKNFIVSYATIKNPAALAKFFLTKRITITFLTPSYVRKLGSNTGPFLRMLFVGSEPANNLYNKNLSLINIYACSFSRLTGPTRPAPSANPRSRRPSGSSARTAMRSPTARPASSVLRTPLSAATSICRRRRQRPLPAAFTIPAIWPSAMKTATFSCWAAAAT